MTVIGLIVLICPPWLILYVFQMRVKTLARKRQNESEVIKVSAPTTIGWYYNRGGSSYGPIDIYKLAQFYRRGVITDQTLIWYEGLENWTPLIQFEFYSSFRCFQSCKKSSLIFLIAGALWLFLGIIFWRMYSFGSIPIMIPLIAVVSILVIYHKMSSSKFRI